MYSIIFQKHQLNTAALAYTRNNLKTEIDMWLKTHQNKYLR